MAVFRKRFSGANKSNAVNAVRQQRPENKAAARGLFESKFTATTLIYNRCHSKNPP
jgi:hypothetical protein